MGDPAAAARQLRRFPLTNQPCHVATIPKVMELAFTAATLAARELKTERNESIATGEGWAEYFAEAGHPGGDPCRHQVVSRNCCAFYTGNVFAIVINPLVSVLVQRGIKRGMAISLVVMILLLALALLVAMVAGSLQEFSEVYPQLQAQSVQKLGVIQHFAARFNLNISSTSWHSGWTRRDYGCRHHHASPVVRGHDAVGTGHHDGDFYAV